MLKFEMIKINGVYEVSIYKDLEHIVTSNYPSNKFKVLDIIRYEQEQWGIFDDITILGNIDICD